MFNEHDYGLCNLMNESAGIIYHFDYEVWVSLGVGIISILLYVLKRQLDKIDEVGKLYLTRLEHEKDINNLEERMIICQENLRQEIGIIHDDVKESAKAIAAVHRRIDDLYEKGDA